MKVCDSICQPFLNTPIHTPAPINMSAPTDPTDIEDIVCAPTRSDIARMRPMHSLSVGVTSLLQHMNGYCEVQPILRSLNGVNLMDRVYAQAKNYIPMQVHLANERSRLLANAPSITNVGAMLQWRRDYARCVAELSAINDVLIETNGGRHGSMPRRDPHGPIRHNTGWQSRRAVARPRKEPLRSRAMYSYTTGMDYMLTGNMIHRKLEFIDDNFVDAMSFKKSRGMTKYYTAQMIRLVASCINITISGRTSEMPIYMFTHTNYGGALGAKSHMISGDIDEVSIALRKPGTIVITDYKSYGNQVPSDERTVSHRAQVSIYMKMFHAFRTFPFRYVHALLRADDEKEEIPDEHRVLTPDDMTTIRYELRYYMARIMARDPPTTFNPPLFESFRRGFCALMCQPSLTYGQVAECAVFCVDAICRSAERHGGGSYLSGVVKYYPRDGHDYTCEENYRRIPITTNSIQLERCFDTTDPNSVTDEEVWAHDELVRIINTGLAVVDGAREPIGSTQWACKGCEYSETCEFKM